VNPLDSTKRHLAAKPLLLPYPRMYVRRLFLRFSAFAGPATAIPPLKFQHKMTINKTTIKD
jgi:hypothetical protein